MLRVKTRLAPSEIHCIGLFAAEFIAKGTITWQRDPEFDFAYDEAALESVPPPVKEQFLKYSYFDFDLRQFVLCSDDQRFMNHSENPNICSTPEHDRALVDIASGEELFCDYTKYERGWFERRGLKRELFKRLPGRPDI